MFAGWLAGCPGVGAAPPPIDLRPIVSPAPFADARAGHSAIVGRASDGSVSNVFVRVTTSRGVASRARLPVTNGVFRGRYPADFAGAPPLEPGALFIDATAGADFNAARPGHFQAEATVIVHGGPAALPDLPSALTSDLLDRRGRTDRRSVEWPVVRALVNRYMRSRGARIVNVGRQNFDLANAADLEWFKGNLTLYEFDYRDRNWSKPLDHRVARTFWQSVWNTWFNSSNDHPLDGNPAHPAQTNYLPYAFANDFADVLVMHLMRLRCTRPLDDNLTAMCREATRNLLAMQQRGTNNFALPDASGKRERYTAGAFRYGMFESGGFLTEGKGWFYNRKFRDYAQGGVLNGRALWALGEALRAEPQGPLAPRLKEAIALALQFCLHDGKAGGYVKQTRQGNIYWRDAGEHAYLLLGMLAACEIAPDLPVALGRTNPPSALQMLCVQSLDALADLEKPEHQWAIYPNVDSMAIAALAEGARLLPTERSATRWRAVSTRVADAWMSAHVDPQERVAPTPQFGLRAAPDRMTYVWRQGGGLQFFHYQDGHWIHALADLYALTRDRRYRERAEALISYLCGNNPWQVRLFNELGGVYNWTDDTDGDGIEDLLKQDMYPESTAFCQIGILRLLRSLPDEK
jgi:hypothetical protein